MTWNLHPPHPPYPTVSLDRVAALLEHENMNTTRIYTTPSLHDLTEAVERLGHE